MADNVKNLGSSLPNRYNRIMNENRQTQKTLKKSFVVFKRDKGRLKLFSSKTEQQFRLFGCEKNKIVVQDARNKQ